MVYRLIWSKDQLARLFMLVLDRLAWSRQQTAATRVECML